LSGAGLARTLLHRRSILALGCALAIGGCGSGRTATPAATHLEREDFTAVCHTLARVVGPVGPEVAATKTAWPLIANGLPPSSGSGAPSAIRTAAARAAALRLPALFGEVQAASLTGPAAHIAGLFRSYQGLAARGWRMIVASIAQIEGGTPAGARFAKANVALYIESVYDGHFTLAQIGKQLIAGYEKLGGATAFGASLSQAEVDALARAYSEATDRLHPHVGVRLGS
jgi:hypothetical protein